MELRNKKTGEIGELHYYPDKAYHFAVSTKDKTQTGIYKTLGEILQDWTDFIVHEPTDPLIKNEKMRKSKKIDDIVNAHHKYWVATSDYVFALGLLEGENNLSHEDIQRSRCMKTELMAERCRIEFELNRLVEKNQ